MGRAPDAVRVAAFLVPFVLCVTSAMPLRAASPDVTEIQSLVNEGERLFQQERFEEALDRYERAHEASGEHLLLFMMARCHQRLDHTRQAFDLFRAFLARPDIPEAPRGKAEMAVQVLEEELERGTIVVQVTPFGAQVLLDGESVGTAPVAPVHTRPGPHEIEVRADGYAAFHRIVRVPAAGEVRVAVELQPTAAAPLPLPAKDDPSPSRARFSPWSWVSLGLGAAAVVAGGATWGVASHNGDELNGAYDKSVWTADEKATYDRDWDDNVVPYQISSYALWGVGGAALVTGVVLVALDFSNDADARTTDAMDFRLAPVIGAAGTGLSFETSF